METATSVVNGVDFVSIPVTDLDASASFYGDVLGLRRSKLWQRPGQEAMGAEFEPGTVTLALIDCAKIGIEFKPTSVPIALHVDDFDAARTALESRGVEFQGETIDSGVCNMIAFRDPDGNALMIHHRYVPEGARPSAA
jgi:catechol 2,3-dioxygenase-like lactoylglutathione lyase family enzyme